MGYDMYALGVPRANRNRDADYFRLNIGGMGETREAMARLDMLSDVDRAPFPEPPSQDEWVEPEDAATGSEWATYHEGIREVLASHPNQDDPRLPSFKLCSNDGWIVTAVECRALVGLWRQRERGVAPDRLPSWWAEWIDWPDRCGRRDGFEVF